MCLSVSTHFAHCTHTQHKYIVKMDGQSTVSIDWVFYFHMICFVCTTCVCYLLLVILSRGCLTPQRKAIKFCHRSFTIFNTYYTFYIVLLVFFFAMILLLVSISLKSIECWCWLLILYLPYFLLIKWCTPFLSFAICHLHSKWDGFKKLAIALLTYIHTVCPYKRGRKTKNVSNVGWVK